MMEEAREAMRFIRYEVRDGVTVAVFALDVPALDWSWDGDDGQASETVFDRPSLEARLANLRATGAPAEATAAALAAWPQAEGRPPETAAVLAEGQIPRPQKTAAVLRLIRGETPEAVARSLGVPAPALLAWRDTFLAAGISALDS